MAKRSSHRSSHRQVTAALDKARLQVLQQLPPMAAMAEYGTEMGGTPAPARTQDRWWRPLARDAKADTLRQLPLQRGA